MMPLSNELVSLRFAHLFFNHLILSLPGVQFASPVMAVLVKLLIAQGADVSKANTRKDTPLHIAVSPFFRKRTKYNSIDCIHF